MHECRVDDGVDWLGRFRILENDRQQTRAYTVYSESDLTVVTACTVAPRHLRTVKQVHIGYFKRSAVGPSSTSEQTPRSDRHSRFQPAIHLTSFVPGDCLWQWLCRAHLPQSAEIYLLTYKGGVTALNERPMLGMLDCVEPSPSGRETTLPLTRHIQVAWELCPMTVPRALSDC